MTLVAPESDTAIELEYLPACESRKHPSGAWGHEPGAPAAYMVGMDDCPPMLLCAGWVQSCLSSDSSFVIHEDHWHLKSRMVVIPLDSF